MTNIRHEPGNPGYKPQSIRMSHRSRLSVVLCTRKNPWSHSIRVEHSPDFGLLSVKILPWLFRKRCKAIFTLLTLFIQLSSGLYILVGSKSPSQGLTVKPRDFKPFIRLEIAEPSLIRPKHRQWTPRRFQTFHQEGSVAGSRNFAAGWSLNWEKY